MTRVRRHIDKLFLILVSLLSPLHLSHPKYSPYDEAVCPSLGGRAYGSQPQGYEADPGMAPQEYPSSGGMPPGSADGYERQQDSAEEYGASVSLEKPTKAAATKSKAQGER